MKVCIKFGIFLFSVDHPDKLCSMFNMAIQTNNYDCSKPLMDIMYEKLFTAPSIFDRRLECN